MRCHDGAIHPFLRAAFAVYLAIMSVALLAGASARAQEQEDQASAPRQYTFAWMFTEDEAMKPRGGTTRGPEVVLQTETAAAFKALQQPGLSKKERDRRAILAMVGEYRTTFDFIETIGFTPGYEPRRPYQSWGTERVYLVADEPGFISLQHIIVMHFADEDGGLSEPMVVKHWRQDWRYEDRDVHAFAGRNSFQKERLSPAEAEGAWTQTVYQVDDSPRYEAVGRWFHAPGVSFWESEDRRRPLPRREFSVRDDYHALFGSHRITLYPTGWAQAEDTLKLVLAEDNTPATEQPYLARELGLSRYERINGYDFAAGDDYWERTAPFWADVRAYWDALYARRDAFAFTTRADGTPMFMALFELAEQDFATPVARAEAIEKTLDPYLQ